MENNARLARLEALFHSREKYLYVVIYVPLTGHITISHDLTKTYSSRIEPQGMILEFDLLTLNWRD